MTRLTNLTPAEKKFIDDAIAAAERAAGKKLNQPNRHIVLNRARAQIESQRSSRRRCSSSVTHIVSILFRFSDKPVS